MKKNIIKVLTLKFNWEGRCIKLSKTTITGGCYLCDFYYLKKRSAMLAWKGKPKAVSLKECVGDLVPTLLMIIPWQNRLASLDNG